MRFRFTKRVEWDALVRWTLCLDEDSARTSLEMVLSSRVRLYFDGFQICVP